MLRACRRSYKIGEVPADRSKKNAAEGATFTAAVQTATKLDSPKAKAQRALGKTKALTALSAKRTATT